MFECKVYLYAFRYDSRSGIFCAVSSTKNSFSPLVGELKSEDPYSINDTILSTLDYYFDTRVELIKPLLIDASRQDNSILLRYMCKMPIDCKMINCYNIPCAMAGSDLFLQKALRYV